MRRHRIFAILIVTSALVAFGPAAAPAVAAPRVNGPLTAPTVDSAVEGYASNVGVKRMTVDGIRTYWTPERMVAAIPARVPAKASAPGGAISFARDAKPMLTEPGPPSLTALAQAAKAAGVPMSTDATVNATVTAGRVFYIDPVDGSSISVPGRP